MPVNEAVQNDKDQRHSRCRHQGCQQQAVAEGEVAFARPGDAAGGARQIVQAPGQLYISALSNNLPREGEEGHVGGEHHGVAVGKVSELQNAVDEGEADGAQGEDAAGDHAHGEGVCLREDGPGT